MHAFQQVESYCHPVEDGVSQPILFSDHYHQFRLRTATIPRLGLWNIPVSVLTITVHSTAAPKIPTHPHKSSCGSHTFDIQIERIDNLLTMTAPGRLKKWSLSQPIIHGLLLLDAGAKSASFLTLSLGRGIFNGLEHTYDLALNSTACKCLPAVSLRKLVLFFPALHNRFSHRPHTSLATSTGNDSVGPVACIFRIIAAYLVVV
ncbi:hypothetical protein IW262DRAFT_683852 [Armillaria fumosa]|nr:hypothetical protein IW262DRAFT_683852 [Armillaria fumosa]